MKKIGIDARLLSQTGVGVYIRNLLYYLERIASPDYQVNIYLMKDDLKKITFKNKNFNKKQADFHWHRIPEQTGYLKFLNQENLDLMHFTYFSYPIFYQKKFIATIHDLTPLLFKTGKASTKNSLFYGIKYSMLKVVLEAQIRNSSAIITPSQTVKKQILENYGTKLENKIYPIFEGVNENLKKTKENTSLKKRFDKFFLCINNFYPHKNTERLIRAFAKVKTNHQLILVGPDDLFAQRISKLINKLKLQQRIILYTDSTLADLVFFYKNAIALINPSLSEGFGLPLLEASYFGCPVLASNIQVFGEIMGNSYLKFDPYDISDISKKIEFFIKKRPSFDYKRIILKYSFEKMAKDTSEIYKKLLS
jgi:glycosyltransferase involved in cell wall biosynthesis